MILLVSIERRVMEKYFKQEIDPKENLTFAYLEYFNYRPTGNINCCHNCKYLRKNECNPIKNFMFDVGGEEARKNMVCDNFELKQIFRAKFYDHHEVVKK
jgi:hypothetical protein